MCHCSEGNAIAEYVFEMGPYLYPFTIEFSILVGNVVFNRAVVRC